MLDLEKYMEVKQLLRVKKNSDPSARQKSDLDVRLLSIILSAEEKQRFIVQFD